MGASVRGGMNIFCNFTLVFKYFFQILVRKYFFIITSVVVSTFDFAT